VDPDQPEPLATRRLKLQMPVWHLEHPPGLAAQDVAVKFADLSAAGAGNDDRRMAHKMIFSIKGTIWWEP
jgi:hypothetical protein